MCEYHLGKRIVISFGKEDYIARRLQDSGVEVERGSGRGREKSGTENKVYLNDFRIQIWIFGVVDIFRFVSFARSVHDHIFVKIK